MHETRESNYPDTIIAAADNFVGQDKQPPTDG